MPRRAPGPSESCKMRRLKTAATMACLRVIMSVYVLVHPSLSVSVGPRLRQEKGDGGVETLLAGALHPSNLSSEHRVVARASRYTRRRQERWSCGRRKRVSTKQKTCSKALAIALRFCSRVLGRCVPRSWPLLVAPPQTSLAASAPQRLYGGPEVNCAALRG